MVKLFRYKQVARITLFGNDDILLNDVNSIYKTQLNGGFHTDEINTKSLKFKLSGNIQNLQLSNNAKLVVESAFLPDLFNYDPLLQIFTPVQISIGNISLRMKGINNDTFDSMGANANTLILNIHNGKNTFFNPSPDKLYNYTISSNFLRNGFLELELIYDIIPGQNIDLALQSRSLTFFQISFVIYDENEEDLLLKDTLETDFKLMKPFNGGIPIFN